MALEHPLIDIADLAPAPGHRLGWDGRAAVRIAVADTQGAALAYHAVIPSGAGRPANVADRDELLIYLAGGGRATVGGRERAVRAGHCQFVPRGTAHAFASDGAGADTLVVGFRPPAGADAGPAGTDAGTGAGTLVHLDDVPPAAMSRSEGWMITDFRLPIGRHSDAGSTLFRARFFPGAVHAKHRHDACDEIYFVISGRGIAGAGRDRAWVHAGHFHAVPKGVEHWLSNLSPSEPIEVVGIYIGAGDVAETGYVYLGPVTEADTMPPPDPAAGSPARR